MALRPPELEQSSLPPSILSDLHAIVGNLNEKRAMKALKAENQ